jgi:hypothetical protein
VTKNTSEKNVNARKRSVLGYVIRFFAWWFGFAGIYAMTTTCPCCGKVGCPVGAGGAGVVGGVMALGMQNWRKVGVFFHRIKNKKMMIKKKPS